MKSFTWFLGCVLSAGSVLGAGGATAAMPDASANLMGNIAFRNVGPSVGGRVAAVAGVPGNPHIYYVGAASGGVFKTTDGGNTWNAIFTHEGSSSIGAITVDPNNPDRVWVGTGESNPRNSVVQGDGVYYSDNGGRSWQHLGLENAGQIARIIVDPHNRNVVYVAALGNPWAPNPERGVFKTEDGGQSWKKLLYVGDTTGAVSLVMQPSDPRSLLAAMWDFQRFPWLLRSGGPKSGIYRSRDGGASWTLLHNGLPGGPLGRIGLAVAPSMPNRVYAVISAASGILWRSDDFGSSWRLTSSDYRMDFRPFYFASLVVAPDDPDKVFFSSFGLMESVDGGKTAFWADRGAHDDHHALWIDPKNPQRMMQGNDGGVNLSEDGGKTWRRLKNMPLAQFYQVGIDNSVPFNMCGGLQDLGVWYGPSNNLGRDANTSENWFTVNGGDGGYCVPAPSDPNVVYSAETGGGNITRYDLKTNVSVPIDPYPVDGGVPMAQRKYRFNWQTPIAVSRTDAMHVYIGGNVVFETKDGGYSWNVISPDLTRNDKTKQVVPKGLVNFEQSSAEAFDTILSLALNRQAPGELWAGTDDGAVQLTRDDGKTWKNVTPPGAPKWARVYNIGTSASAPGTAFVPFDAHGSGDNKPYAFRTTDYGKHWTAITNGLPGFGYINVIRSDPLSPHLLVLGSDNGLYYSLNDGGQWQRFENFPTVPVRDLKFSEGQHDLVVASHGRGLFVLDDIRPLEEFSSQVASEAFHLFTPGPAVEFRHWLYDARWETDYTAYRPPNPDDGAYIDFYVGAGSPENAGNVEFRVTGPDGRVVSTFSAPARRGVGRYVWDMRYADSTSLDFVRKPPAGPGPPGHDIDPNQGPLVPPGEYQLQAQYGGVTRTATIRVVKDPNVNYDEGLYADYAREALLARDTLSRLSVLVNSLHGLKTQTAKIAASGNDRGKLRGLLEAVDDSVNRMLSKTYESSAGHIEITRSSPYQQTLTLARQLAATFPYRLPPATLNSVRAYKSLVDGYVGEYDAGVARATAAYNNAAKEAHAQQLSVGEVH